MTISVDSAIHSATGSRSASSSPLPTGLGQSLLRYAPWQPFPQVHVPVSPHESHVTWEPTLKSTPKMSESQPSCQELVSQSCESQPAHMTWPRTCSSAHPKSQRESQEKEQKAAQTRSSSYDSALELSLSDRLVESCTELLSP